MNENGETRIMRKEAFNDYLKVLSDCSPGGYEKNHEETSVRIAGLRTENRTQDTLR